MKGKPIRFGYKIWMICSSQGFPFAFKVYIGKSNLEGTPLGEQVTERLTQGIQCKANHVLYMDNFFSSTAMFRDQLQQNRLRCTGTVRRNRIDKCPLISKEAMAKTERGFSETYSDGSVVVCHWNDNTSVIVVICNAAVIE